MSKSLAEILLEMAQPKKKLIEAVEDYAKWKADVRAAYPKATFDKEGDEYINTASEDGVEIASFENGEGHIVPVDEPVGHIKPEDSADVEIEFEDDLDEAKASKDDESADEDDKEKVKEVDQDDTEDKKDDDESNDLDLDDTEAKVDDKDADKDVSDEFSLDDLADEEPASDEEQAALDALSDDEPKDDLDSDEDDEEDTKSKKDDDEVTVVVVSPDHDLESDEDKEEEDKKKKEAPKEFTAQEHVSALLDGETLSEEFKEKTRIIFEQAVNAAIKERAVKQDAKLLKKYNEKIAAMRESIEREVKTEFQLVESKVIQSVDGFLTSEAKKWAKDNRVALEKNIRADLAEGFIDGLKTLFVESYIDVPEEKFDVIGAQAEAIKQLEESLSKSKTINTKLLRNTVKLERAAIVAECMADLTDTQKVRMEKLVESVGFEKADDFKKQVLLMKESYFTDKKETIKPEPRKALIEEIEIEVEPVTTVKSSPTQGYAEAISRLFVQ